MGIFRTKLLWFPILYITVLHVVTLWVLLNFPYLQNMKLIAWTILVTSATVLGATAGVHRLWSHRSYKATLPLRAFLMLCFCLAVQKSVCNWVKHHRTHHKYSETDADPHNSKRGFFFSHVGWLMMEELPEVTKRKNEMDISDMLEDSVIRFHERYYSLLTFSTFAFTTLVPPLVWGQDLFWSFMMVSVVRPCYCLNIVWCINSIAHMMGTKPYNKNIAPSDNLLACLLTMGEGWHNYHHTFPWDYRTGELLKYNFTTGFLDFCGKLGLAYDFKSASDDMVRKTALKKGDGSRNPWYDAKIGMAY